MDCSIALVEETIRILRWKSLFGLFGEKGKFLLFHIFDLSCGCILDAFAAAVNDFLLLQENLRHAFFLQLTLSPLKVLDLALIIITECKYLSLNGI